MRLPKNSLCRTAGLILFVLLSAETFAHESRPAYLEITEIQPHVYSVIWKRPQQGGRSLALHPVWPDGVRDLTPPTQQLLPTAVLEQRTIAMDGAGLIGQTLSIEGLASTLTDVLVRIQLLDGRTQTTLVKPSSPTFTVQAAQSLQQNVCRAEVGNDQVGIDVEALFQCLGTDQDQTARGALAPDPTLDLRIEQLAVFAGKAAVVQRGYTLAPKHRRVVWREGEQCLGSRHCLSLGIAHD